LRRSYTGVSGGEGKRVEQFPGLGLKCQPIQKASAEGGGWHRNLTLVGSVCGSKMEEVCGDVMPLLWL